MTRLRKSSGVSNPVSVFSTNSRDFDSMRPAGICTFSLLQRGLDVLHREPPGGERRAIEPNAHGIAPIAREPHARHAGQRREPVHDVALGVVRELEAAERVAREVDEDDRLGVGVRLGDFRRLGLFGQRAHHAADAVADIVGRFVDVAVERRTPP